MVRTVAARIKRAAEAKPDRGDLPGGWQEMIEDVLGTPQIPWSTHLRHVARRASAFRPGAWESTYRKISRRQAGVGFGPGCPVLTGSHRPVLDIWLAVDTSGSMGKEELIDVMSEAQGILAEVGGKLTMLAFDAAVHVVQDIHNIKQMQENLIGRGGTNFFPVFQRMAKAPKKPDVLVIGTDGHGPAPAAPPVGVSVIWLLVGPYARPPVSWGDQVQVKQKRR